MLLGIDIGTSACKVALFDLDGKVITHKSKSYSVYYPQKGWAEQNPVEWWEAVAYCIKEITSAYDPSKIQGIGIDGQSWSAITVDEKRNVLCNTPIWMDTRSSEICNRVKAEFGEHPFFDICKNPFEPTYTLPKIMWYKENLPDVYEKTDKILQSNGYIAMMLTDNISCDYSQGYGLQCYDVSNNKWDMSVMEKLGLRTDILPELCHCHKVVGTVTEKASKETGLAVGTPVVAGGLDAACGTLGAGVIEHGQTQEQGGQAGGMSICQDTPIGHKALILSNHVVADKWLLQGGTVGGGGVVNWFEKHFCEFERNVSAGNVKDKQTDKNSFEQMSDLAGEVPVGSDGLIFLPYMSGERSPIWDTEAKGVYFGLDFSKTKGHFIRASMEGVGFSLEHNLQAAKEVGATVSKLYPVGGSANSLVWTQLKSDITGLPMVIPYSDSATTLGAVILAGVGVGAYSSFDEAVKRTVTITRTHEPNMENNKIYSEIFKKYLKLYDQTKDLMKEC